MSPSSPSGAHDPLRTHRTEGGRAALQQAFFDVRDPEWVAFLIRRLQAGDVVKVDRWGDFVLMDGD
jgi:hypothetical protein